MSDPKVLFLPSCDGIGHAGRMLLVARALRERFDGKIEFAGNGPYGTLFPQAGFPFHEVGGGFAHHRLRFLYTRWSIPQLVSFFREGVRSLRRVVEGELELYREVKPDLIVWDGRFTVPVSAWVASLPFVSVFHPHLTPYSALDPCLPRNLPLFVRYPALDLITRLPKNLQTRLARHLWKGLHSLFLRLYNTLLAGFGGAPAQRLEEVLERSRAAILPDLEITAPTVNLPKTFAYVGPLVWEPDGKVPEALLGLRDLIYVTMGSSGNPRVFKPLIQGLARMPEVQVVMTLARLVPREVLAPLPPNVHVYDYLPGTEIAKRARLVICHSAPTMYQALSQGVPVIGVPFNIPHEVAICRIEALGAGLKLLSNELTPERITRTVKAILEDPGYRAAAARIGSQCRLEEGPKRAAEVILGGLDRTAGAGGSAHA